MQKVDLQNRSPADGVTRVVLKPPSEMEQTSCFAQLFVEVTLYLVHVKGAKNQCFPFVVVGLI